MAETVKISELDELVSGSILGTTILPVVDGGTTQYTQMSSIKAYVNSDVATDSELSAQISAVNSTINTLTTDNISEGSNEYYTDAKVKSKLNTEGVISGSTLSVVGGGSVNDVTTITFSGATVTGAGGNAVVSIETPTSLTVEDGITTVNNVDTITFSGATITDLGSGNITVANSTTLNVEGDGGDGGEGVTNITFVGATVTDNGGGFIDVTIASSGDSVAMMAFTSSTDAHILGIATYTSSVNTTLASIDSHILDVATFTASFSESVDSRLVVLEEAEAAIPNGTISGSQQITDFGFVSSSFGIDNILKLSGGEGVLITSSSGASLDITIEVAAAPGGGGGDGVTYPIGYHIISQSTADYSSNAILSGMYVDENLNVTFNSFSSSLDSRFGSGGGSDYISNVAFANNTLSFTGTGFGFNGSVPLSDGIVSSSTQLDNLGYITTDDLTSGFIATVLPQGTVSGSTQLDELGFISTENTPNLITGSGQVILADADNSNFDTSYVEENVGYLYYTDERVKTKLDLEGIFSSSEQILLAPNLVSSSVQVDYADISNKLEIRTDLTSSAILITSGTADYGNPYITLALEGSGYAPYSVLERFNVISASYISSTILSGSELLASEQLTSLGALTTSTLNSALSPLNGFTGSLGEFGLTSASLASRIDTIAATGFEIETGFQLISQSDSVSNLILDLVRIDDTGTTFNDFSASVASGVGAGSSTFASLTDTEFSSFVGGDLVKYNATTEKWENSLQLNGAYVITGSLFVTGGAVTADSFIAGDVGTPIIDSATSLDISAATEVYITSTGNGVVIEDIMVLNKVIGDAPTSPLTGSLMNSGSVDEDTKLWFFNGTEWKEIAFV